MTISIFNRQRRLTIDLTKWSKRTELLFQEVCKNLQKKLPPHLTRSNVKTIAQRGSLTLMLVGNKKIRALNKQWREKDYATDVLSFPLIFDQSGAEFFPTLAEEELELGEIVISMEKAEEQARELGHSLDRELAFLFVHGTLHILGFDHMTKAQEKDMFSRQTSILNEAGFTR